MCGGGRYDYLVEELGGDSVPAIGFAAGFERLVMALNDEVLKPKNYPDLYIISLGDNAISMALNIALELRKNNALIVINDMLQRSLKVQMKDANRLNVKYVLIIGEDELKNNSMQLKNMQTGEQQLVKIDQKICETFKSLII